MKKAFAISAALVVISASALADPVVGFISEHNVNRIITGAAEVTGQPEIIKGKNLFRLGNIDIILSADNNGIKSFSCVCYDESATGEFLAQCVTAFYDIGCESFTDCYAELLSEYLYARSGKETAPNKMIPGVMFQVTKTENRYIFIIVKVG
jgi:hypothetical protein